jgi:hypothetical protein
MPEYISRAAAMPDGFCVGVSCQECPFCDDPIKGGCKVVRFIDAIPAADVVEVVHASWVWNPDGMDWGIGAWVCGKCKSRPETWWNTVKECHPLRCSGSRYCGNCGAKMDGGQDDGD